MTTRVDLLTSRAFERVARSYERGARASESSTFVPGPTTPDQKTKRTTLRKSTTRVTEGPRRERFFFLLGLPPSFLASRGPVHSPY